MKKLLFVMSVLLILSGCLASCSASRLLNKEAPLVEFERDVVLKKTAAPNEPVYLDPTLVKGLVNINYSDCWANNSIGNISDESRMKEVLGIFSGATFSPVNTDEHKVEDLIIENIDGYVLHYTAVDGNASGSFLVGDDGSVYWLLSNDTDMYYSAPGSVDLKVLHETCLRLDDIRFIKK